ncbi:MAG: phosphodiester glycosidase family protein [Acidimicrobiales bacterium]
MSFRKSRTRAAVFVAVAAMLATLVGDGVAAARPRSSPASGPTAAPGGARRVGQASPTPASWLPSTPANWPLVVGKSRTVPIEVTSGITQTETNFQTVAGPQRANVLSVDLANPNTAFRVVLAKGRIESGTNSDEVVSSMANRTGAVAGTNGDYFFGDGRFPTPLGQGQPVHLLVQGGQVTNGLALRSSPTACATLSFTSAGTASIGDETFSGVVSAGGSSYRVGGVNTPVYPEKDSFCGQATPRPGLVVVTHEIGKVAPLSAPAPVAELSPAGGSPRTFTVTSVLARRDQVPLPAAGDIALVGEGASASFVGTLKAGASVQLSVTLSPRPDVTQAVGGGMLLVQDGKLAYGGAGSGPTEALTGVGVTKGGHHLIVAVFDGIQPSFAVGLERSELAGYLLAHGAWAAMEFDSGGSSEMVVRQPGARRVSVANSPSDGQQRPVAECLCFYSTEAAPGAAATAVVNGGQPLTLLAGTSVTVGAYGLNAVGNPSVQRATVTVSPAGIATVSGDTITAPPSTAPPGAGESGQLTVTAGQATSSVPLRVVASLSSLSISPRAPDLAPGASQAFLLNARAPGGATLSLPPGTASWRVRPSSLGTISDSGVFTASRTASGMATVTARAGGARATASVAVGGLARVIDPMTDVASWNVSGRDGATGRVGTSSKAPPGASGSMEVSYDMPPGSGVKQVVLSPNTANDEVTSYKAKTPTAVGIWIKGGSPAPSPASPLGGGALTLAESYAEVNGQSVVLYPTTVDFAGWTLVEGSLPVGVQYPLTLNFLDLLVINPRSTLHGHVYLSDLEAIYSSRPAPRFHYVAEPRNPPWLRFTENPAHFTPGATTLAAFDDAHLYCADPKSTGSVVLSDIGRQLRRLPAREHPQMVQANGDMADSGTMCDLEMVKSALSGFGIAYHESAGNGEIGNGAYPENGNFAKVFGATHYAYSLGPATVVVLDSSFAGVEASDPYQVPTDQKHQYAFLVSELDATQAKIVFVVVHTPPYSPHPRGDSQFSNRYEAQMFELLAAKYQASHPGVHLVLLLGQARGYAEQVLNSAGRQVVGGIPNFVVADAGVPAYAPANEGGFYNYVLFHLRADGTVQFAVQPVLSSIKVRAPRPSLAVGSHESLVAVGTTPTGNNLPPLQVPIENPASHYWTSSDAQVATVNAVSGVVSAHRRGSATISVTADGITASTAVRVTRRAAASATGGATGGATGATGP